jgi:hypothetical protein
MRKRWMLVGLLALAIVALLAGCGGTEATETVPADEVPVVASDADGKVVAEAVVEPARWSEVRFEKGISSRPAPRWRTWIRRRRNWRWRRLKPR